MAQTTAQSTLDLLILKTLDRGPNHGFGITNHIQKASEGLLRIDEGSLYPALHRLERDGLISGKWAISENARRARFYDLTKAGRERLKEHEGDWRSLSAGVTRVLEFAL
jgi:transcriptional regulator